MRRLLVFVFLTALALSGCDLRANLYPVQGPLTQQTPPPVFAVQVKGYNGPGRDVTVAYAGGEVLSGQWAKVPGAANSKNNPAASSPGPGNLSPEWDTIYGSGYYVAHILGKAYNRAVLKGSNGTTMTVEMFGPPELKGVAKDNHDNIYKLVFY